MKNDINNLVQITIHKDTREQETLLAVATYHNMTLECIGYYPNKDNNSRLMVSVKLNNEKILEVNNVLLNEIFQKSRIYKATDNLFYDFYIEDKKVLTKLINQYFLFLNAYLIEKDIIQEQPFIELSEISFIEKQQQKLEKAFDLFEEALPKQKYLNEMIFELREKEFDSKTSVIATVTFRRYRIDFVKDKKYNNDNSLFIVYDEKGEEINAFNAQLALNNLQKNNKYFKLIGIDKLNLDSIYQHCEKNEDKRNGMISQSNPLTIYALEYVFLYILYLHCNFLHNYSFNLRNRSGSLKQLEAYKKEMTEMMGSDLVAISSLFSLFRFYFNK